MKFKFNRLNQLEITSYLFSIYVIITSLWLFPYASLLYSNHGIASSTAFFLLSPSLVSALLVLIIALAVLSFFIKQKDVCYLPMLIIWIFLKSQNRYSITLEQHYLVYLGLFLSYNYYLVRHKLPQERLKYAAWILLGSGYFVASIVKLQDPLWFSGDAVYLIVSKLAIPYDLSSFYLLVRAFTMTLPSLLLKIGTYSIMFFQLIFLPCLFIKKLRLAAWLGITLVQGMACIFLPIPDICLGVLLFHVYCFPTKGSLEA